MAHHGFASLHTVCVPACCQSPARATIDAPQHGPAKTGSRSAPSRQRLPLPHVRVHPRAAWHRCRLLLLPAMRRVRSRLVATRAARGNGATTVPADHLIHRNQPSPSSLVAASCTAGRVLQREAKMVASLNHPHIVTLFSVEEPRHSPSTTAPWHFPPSTTAPWHFRASRRPFLFCQP